MATWNLSNLSGDDLAGCHGRTQSDYDEIKRVINQVDADVWLFQEVESNGAMARIMSPGAWSFFTEDRPDWSRQPPCLRGDGSARMQRTGIAVRKELAIGKATDLKFLDVSGKGNLRYGLSVTIAMGARAIEIINVHLKSGCSEGSAAEACGVLFEQTPYLASYLAESTDNGFPVILGGDFNRRLAVAGDDVFSTLSYNKGVGMAISSVTGVSRCSLKQEEPIDYILTSADLRSFLTVEDAFEYSFTGPFESWPSDHCPVVVRFRM